MMKRTLIAALAMLPLLAAPALAVTMMPKVKAPATPQCVGEAPADCATVHQVPYRR
jgi:hypothetical protein